VLTVSPAILNLVSIALTLVPVGRTYVPIALTLVPTVVTLVAGRGEAAGCDHCLQHGRPELGSGERYSIASSSSNRV
jgi:hypothetical protein